MRAAIWTPTASATSKPAPPARGKPVFAWLLLVFVGLLVRPRSVEAHPFAVSSFDARTDGGAIDFAFRFDSTSVVELLRRKHPDAGDLRKKNIADYDAMLREYFDAKFLVFNDDRPCAYGEPRVFEYNEKLDKLMWEIRFDCSGELGTVRLRSELFLSEENPHQIIGNFRHERAQERYFFTGGEREATIVVGELRQQKGPLPAMQSTFGPPPGVKLAVPPEGAIDKGAPPTKAAPPTRTPGISPQSAKASREAVATASESDEAIRAQPAGFGHWFEFGISHIFEGYDHLLFVLCLVIVVTSWKRLALVITSFTLAHSITLALGALDLVVVSPVVVEPAVALTILWVALENVFRSEPEARARITFAFGLIHGFAFSGVLRDAGMSGGDLLTPLLGFNLGVEAGQLILVLPLFPGVLWLQKQPERAKRARVVVGIGVAVMAVYWFIERVFLG